MDSTSARQLFQVLAGQKYDPDKKILPQATALFVPIPRTRALEPTASWKGFFYGRCYSLIGSREREVAQRIREAWEALKESHEWGGLDIPFQTQLSQELDAPIPSLYPHAELQRLDETRRLAQRDYDENPFPKSLLRNLDQTNGPITDEALQKAFRPAEEELEHLEAFLSDQNPQKNPEVLSAQRELIQCGLEIYSYCEKMICETADPNERRQKMQHAAAVWSREIKALTEGQKMMFCGGYGVRATVLGIARYALKQVAKDRIPGWLKPFLVNGNIPDPQALVEGIVYQAIQRGLDAVGKTVGIVLEDMNFDRSVVEQVSLPDPGDYVEGLLKRAFTKLQDLSGQLQPPEDIIEDLSGLFPDEHRSMPGWMAKVVPDRVKENVERLFQTGLLGNLASLLPDSAVKNLINFVVRSAYMVEDSECRRTFLEELETELTKQICTGLGSGLGFLDEQLDDLVASAAETLPQQLFSWTDLDLIGFGAPCWLEFQRTEDDYYKVRIYPLGIALNHDWHNRDANSGMLHWPLEISVIKEEQLSPEFFYQLCFHAFEPQCDPQVTLRAPEFYQVLRRLGTPYPVGAVAIDRRRNDNGYLVQAMLSQLVSKTAIRPELVEFKRHKQAFMSACIGAWNEAARTLVFDDLQRAELFFKTISQLNTEGKKLFKKQLITARESEQLIETKREVALALEECRRRTLQQTTVLEKVRTKVLQLEQSGVHSLQEAREWLSWALGEEVGTLIEALAEAIPASEAAALPTNTGTVRGWLKEHLQRLGGWETVRALSDFLGVIESLRSTLAPLHAVRLAHNLVNRLAPQPVADWYHAVLRLASQKLSDLAIYVVLRCLSLRLGVDRFKRIAAAKTAFIERITEEIQNERTVLLDCSQPLFQSAVELHLAPAAKLQGIFEPQVQNQNQEKQVCLEPAYLTPISNAADLTVMLSIWAEEDKQNSNDPALNPFLYQRMLARVSLLPVPIANDDPIWDRVDEPEKVLQTISSYGRCLHRTHIEFDLREDEYIIAQYSVLFIVEKLTRRISTRLLEGWEVNAYNLLRYAKGALTGYSPQLEQRLTELLQYRFPKVALEALPAEETIRQWADASLFSRRGSQPTKFTEYIDWYLKRSETINAFRRQLTSGLSQEIIAKWGNALECWHRYLKRQINDTHSIDGGFPLELRLLRYHSLCAHYAVTGKAWQPEEISEGWHEAVVNAIDVKATSTITRFFGSWKADKQVPQPETEDATVINSAWQSEWQEGILCPQHGRLEYWLDPSILRLSVERHRQADILSEGPAEGYFQEAISPALLRDFEQIFCNPRNQLQRTLAFLMQYPQGIWKDNPHRMTDFLYAMLFQAGHLRREMESSSDFPHTVVKVFDRLIQYYLSVEPSVCVSLIIIAIYVQRAHRSVELKMDAWLAFLWDLPQPQFRDAVAQLRALHNSFGAIDDRELVLLCSGLIRETETEDNPAFIRLDRLMMELYYFWQPFLAIRMAETEIRRSICSAALERMRISVEPPRGTVWDPETPLTIRWEGFELDLARRRLTSSLQIPLVQLERLAKERAKTLGISTTAWTDMGQGRYEAGDFRMEITGAHEVHFYRLSGGHWYRHIELSESPSGNVGRQLKAGTLWLQEAEKKLLVCKPEIEETWLIDYLDGKIQLKALIAPDGSHLVPVRIDQWLRSLSPLRGFCPLGRISCYADAAETQLRRIVFDLGATPLVFNVRTQDGKQAALAAAPELQGFQIAQNQVHPALEGLGGYLILESRHAKKVLLLGGQWVAAGIWKGIEQLQIVPFLRRWLTDAAIQSQPCPEDSLHTFDLVGNQLFSDNPSSQTYLMYLYIGLGRYGLAEQISTRLERLCYESPTPLSDEFVEGLFPLALIPQKLNKRIARLRYQLFAALEFHRCRLPQKKVRTGDSPPLTKIYYLLLIASTLTDLLNILKNQDRTRQITEEQEYLLFQRFTGLVTELQATVSGAPAETVSEYVLDIFKGFLNSTGQGPELILRYCVLRKKFGIKDSFTTRLASYAKSFWDSPAELINEVNPNYGDQFFKPVDKVKKAVKNSLETIFRPKVDIDYNYLAHHMSGHFNDAAPLSFADLSCDSFIENFLTYYTIAFQFGGSKRLKNLIVDGGWGDPASRFLMSSLQIIAQGWVGSTFALFGVFPKPEELARILLAPSGQGESGQKVEALKIFIEQIDAAIRASTVTGEAGAATATFGASLTFNAVFGGGGTGFVVGTIVKGAEKVKSGLLQKADAISIVEQTTQPIHLSEKSFTTFSSDDDYFDQLLKRFFKQTFQMVPEYPSLFQFKHGANSCRELCVNLQPLCNQLKQAIDQERSDLLDFVNKHPRRRGQPFTFDEMRNWLANSDFQPLYNALPQLPIQEIDRFEKALLRHLLRTTRVLQFHRILKHARTFSQNPNRQAAEKLFHELRARRAYNPDTILLPFLRVIVTFEEKMDTLIWPTQYGRIERILYDFDHLKEEKMTGILMEAMPGTGKTFVTGPIVMKIRSMGQRLICMASPQQFADINVNRIGGLHRNVWGQISNVVTFSRRNPLTPDQLSVLHLHFEAMIKHSQLLHMTQTDAQGLYLLMVSLLYRVSKQKKITTEDKKLFLGLQKIQKLLRFQGELHAEEAHVQFHFLKQLCYPEGSFAKISEADAAAASQVIQLFDTIHSISVMSLRHLYEPYYKQEIAPKLARSCSALPQWEHLTEERRTELANFLSGTVESAADWMQDDPNMYRQISMMSLVIRDYLPKCACKKRIHTDIGQGIGHSAGPQLGNTTPDKNSVIKDPIEQLVKTLIVYYADKLTVEQLKQLIGDLKERAEKERTLPSNQRVIENLWPTLVPKIDPLETFSLDSLSEEAIQKLQRNPKLINLFVIRFAVPEIHYYPTSSLANAYNWSSMYGSILASGGTLYNKDLCAAHLKSLDDADMAAVVKRILSTKISGIDAIDANSSLEILQQELKAYFQPGSPYKAIVDGASLFTGLKPFQVAAMMLKHADNREDIHGVVFCDSRSGQDRWVVISKGNPDPIPLEQSAIEPAKRYTYFDELRTYSADVDIGGCAIVNIDQNTKYFEFIQWIFRDRGIKDWNRVLLETLENTEQSVRIVTHTIDFQAIFPDSISSVDTLVKHIRACERKFLLELSLPSYQLQLKDIVSKHARDAWLNVPGLQQAVKIFKLFLSVFITEQNYDPIERRKRAQVNEYSTRLALNFRAQMIDFAKKFGEERFPSIAEEINDLPEPEFPEKTLAYRLSDDSHELALLNESLTMQMTEEQRLNLHQVADQQLQNETASHRIANYNELPWEKMDVATKKGKVVSVKPKQSTIISNTVRKARRISIGMEETPPIYTLRSVLKKFAPKSLQNVAKAFDKRLWVTNNWIPASVSAQAGTPSQRQLQDVLIRFDENNRVIWMGCLAECDSEAWMKELETKPNDDRAVYSMTERRIRAGKHVPRKMLKQDEDFVRLETQLRFLSGLSFTPKQQQQLTKWMRESGAHAMSEAYQNIRHSRNEGQGGESVLSYMFI